ncbi:LysR family transcriptional regulator [Bacteriovoracaceae bacterium]|nr:LysR family transcriptional regulator [Bacteriovoracaceae bacterium]
MYLIKLVQHFEKVPVLVAIADFGSITKASAHLALSQAAVSQSLKRFEEALGIELFIRSKTGLTLTLEGKTLIKGARKILEEIELLEQEVITFKKQKLSKMRIGTHETLAIHFWPEIVEKFKKSSPSYDLSIMSGRIHSLRSQIENRDLDLILTVRPLPTPGINSIKIYDDSLEFYGSKGKKNSIIDFDDLKKIPILTDCQAHLTEAKSLISLLLEFGIVKNHSFELNSFQAAAKLAAKDMGLALIPKAIVSEMGIEKTLKVITVRGLNKKKFKHSIYLSYLKNRKDEEGILKLIKVLRNNHN